MLLVAAVVLASMWGLRAVLPYGFMPNDYAIWQAKLGLVRQCALAPTIILGDSRATAGIDPRRAPGTVNLALTGAGPIESFYLLEDIVRTCPHLPRRIVVSFITNHFVNDQLFWPYSATFGLLDRRDLDEIRRLSRRLRDPVVYPPASPFDINGQADALLYGIRFPTSYAGNLIEGGLVRRYAANRAIKRDVLRSLGYHAVGTDPGFAGVSLDARVRRFQPSRLLSAYFERLVALAEASGIEILFIQMPMNPASAAAVSPALLHDFDDDLDRVSASHPAFHVLDHTIPVLPATMFGDHDLHLNHAGAEHFSAVLAERLAGVAPWR